MGIYKQGAKDQSKGTKASALKQLRQAIHKAGINSVGVHKGGLKKKQRAKLGGAKRNDESYSKKVETIRDLFNPFELKHDKVKNKVLGGSKQTVGKPTKSKQVGNDNRKKSLLVEYKNKHKSGGLIDKRFGENDTNMNPEDKILARFTKEKQRKAKGSTVFALEEEEELTHYGQSLGDMENLDDLYLSDEDDHKGAIDQDTVSAMHFGGFDLGTGENSDGKKSKQEVMKEVIAKSKMHKYQRQKLKEDDDQLRMDLDEELKEIKGLLLTNKDNRKPLVPQSSLFKQADLSKSNDEEPEQADEYDQFVRQLAFDKRAKASDRLKTEEEEALDEKNRLEKLERHRVRRMQGLNSDTEDDSDDEEQQTKSSKSARPSQGDDLDDGDFDSLNSTLNIGDGLKQYQIDEDEDDDEDEDEDEEDEKDGDLSDLDLEDEDSMMPHSDSDAEIDSPPTKRSKQLSDISQEQEIPYTFSCPSSYDEFTSLISKFNPENKHTVLSRIRVIYHVKLSPLNKDKLQSLLGFLLEYLHDITLIDSFPTKDINVVIQHITELASQFPDHIAQLALEQLQHFRDEFNQEENEDTPTLGHLVFLKLFSQLFSASDYYHAIITPASLLIGQYLSQMNYSSPNQLGKQLFLCGIFLDMQSLSKRFVPETISVILNILYLISPLSVKGHLKQVSFLPHNRQILSHTSLNLSTKYPSEPSQNQLNFSLLKSNEHNYFNSPSYVGSLLNISCNMLLKLVQLYQSIPAFSQMAEPFRFVLQTYLDHANLSEAYKDLISCTLQNVTDLINLSTKQNVSLQLQRHKPVAIKTVLPKFQENYSLDKHYDPDRDRAEMRKLQSQLKKETKGAIRELRKDAQFLAREKLAEIKQSDKAYQAKVKSIMGELSRTEGSDEKFGHEQKKR